MKKPAPIMVPTEANKLFSLLPNCYVLGSVSEVFMRLVYTLLFATTCLLDGCQKKPTLKNSCEEFKPPIGWFHAAIVSETHVVLFKIKPGMDDSDMECGLDVDGNPDPMRGLDLCEGFLKMMSVNEFRKRTPIERSEIFELFTADNVIPAHARITGEKASTLCLLTPSGPVI